MAPPDETSPGVPGQPDPTTVVTEKQYQSPKPQGGRYRILVTNEVDPYDRPMEEQLATLLAMGPESDDFAGARRSTISISSWVVTGLFARPGS